MKYITFILVVISLVFPFPSSALTPPPIERVPLYRLYSAKADDHFYTTSLAEAQAAAGIGYRLEGNMGELSVREMINTVPVFRLYSASLNNHFYTTSGGELASATQSGFRLEGVIGYAPDYLTNLQVYRLYNSRSGDHFYTVDHVERNNAEKLGYVQEGILSHLFTTAAHQIKTGTWGGEHVNLYADSGGALLDFDCAVGYFSLPILDGHGDFSADGTYTPGGGPMVVGHEPMTHPAIYAGNITGDKMTLVINLKDNMQHLGPYTLTYNTESNLFRCL